MVPHGPRWVRLLFFAAALYGLAVLLPQYLRPPVRGAEAASYGFIGTAAVFQLAFLLIARDPPRWRALMPLAVLEKLAFSVPVALLYLAGRADALLLGFGLADLALAVAFLVAWRATPR